jgi:hypothetical protein
MNNFRYGLTGSSFTVLEFEDQDEYERVLCGLRFEHQPATMTESILVEKMAQSYWLSKRALYLQDQCATDEDLNLEQEQKQLALFIRYQTTHDRTFHRSLNDLLKLRAEKRRQEMASNRRSATRPTNPAAPPPKNAKRSYINLPFYSQKPNSTTNSCKIPTLIPQTAARWTTQTVISPPKRPPEFAVQALLRSL